VRNGAFKNTHLYDNVPSAFSSAHATTRGEGPDPRFGFMSWRSSALALLEDPEEEMTICAAFTIFEVDLSKEKAV
jgi:hypothetical protein